MHLLVLSAFRPRPVDYYTFLDRSQCTFWCSVLSDCSDNAFMARSIQVSMHLLVLSAFRLGFDAETAHRAIESQCTFWCSVLSDPPLPHRGAVTRVSMHLLVLSAFRPELAEKYAGWLIGESQCTFWCSVLSDR